MVATKGSSKHTWLFKRHLKPNTFSWKSSALAAKRLKEALAEIKAVNKWNSSLAAQGVVDLAERIWPAFAPIDTSSGMLGTAVYNTLIACIPIFSKSELPYKERQPLLERLFEALQQDGVDYLSPLGDHWGYLCASDEIASQWANFLMPTLRRCWSDAQPGSHFSGATACLSALLRAKRHSELNELLQICPVKMWDYTKYEFDSLVSQGRKAEAIRFAQQMASEINAPMARIQEACEGVLLSSGLYLEAYEKFGLTWTQRNSNIATFRALVKKYPQIDKKRILRDLVAQTPGEEGKWFATAKDLGDFDLALELATLSPCDPKTLNRAAEKYSESNPEFSMRVALISLRWLCEGYGYEITNFDVIAAYMHCLNSAAKIGLRHEAISKMLEIIEKHSHDGFFVRDSLKPYLVEGV